MIRVEINAKDGELTERDGVRKDTGEILTFRQQIIYIYNGGIYPEKGCVSLEKDEKAYPFGVYTFSDCSYVIGNFGVPMLKKYFKLVPHPLTQK